MPWVDAFDREMSSRFPELEILQEEPMAAHTTFRIGGPARRFARPRSSNHNIPCSVLYMLVAISMQKPS